MDNHALKLAQCHLLHREYGLHDILTSNKLELGLGERPSLPNPQEPSSDRMERRVRAYSHRRSLWPNRENRVKAYVAESSQRSVAGEIGRESGLVKDSWFIKGTETQVSCWPKSFPFSAVFVMGHIVINVLAPFFFFNSPIFLDSLTSLVN